MMKKVISIKIGYSSIFIAKRCSTPQDTLQELNRIDYIPSVLVTNAENYRAIKSDLEKSLMRWFEHCILQQCGGK